MKIIFGKVICMVLGLLAYGPYGLVLGLVIGHIFDKSLNNIMHPPQHAEHVRALFFKTVFEVIGCIAKADGHVSEREIQTVREIMLSDFRLTPQHMQLAIRYFNHGKSVMFNLPYELHKFKFVCRDYIDLRNFFLELIVKAATAEGRLSTQQHKLLENICIALNISIQELNTHLYQHGYGPGYVDPQRAYSAYSNYSSADARSNTEYERPREPKVDALSAAYRLLGVQPQDNIKVVKAAYRKLVSQYHPDKLASKGLPKEMMENAKQKTQQITAAYDLIMRSRS